MIKISLKPGIKQSQGIALTPQLLQSIKLFELNNLELGAYLTEEILENPFLQTEDDIHGEDFINNEELTPDNDKNDTEANLDDLTSETGSSDDDYSSTYDDSFTGSAYELTNILEETLPYRKSINEVLTEQANLTFSDSLDRHIAYLLIGNLEADGYFKTDILELSGNLNVSDAKFREVLSVLKRFEPVGIFAESLSECLYAQLKQMNLINDPMNHLLENLYELANGNIKQLSKICGVDNSDIFKMLKDIRKCKSKPLSNYSEESITITEPDIIVKKSLLKWTVELNENNLPRILVNTGYWEELARKKISKEDKKYLSDRYASGKWLLKALEQREATILRVSTEIIKQQNDFLERGLAYMRPMILKDIANELDLHESTISRITNSKEISTPRGVFQLKFFFSKNISKSDGGEDISSEVVKNKIKIFINKERDKILSDSKLALLLKESGINVARRTVTKYRVNMRIPSSFERKKIRKLVT